jgi:putative heme iron utilization protein
LRGYPTHEEGEAMTTADEAARAAAAWAQVMAARAEARALEAWATGAQVAAERIAEAAAAIKTENA